MQIHSVDFLAEDMKRIGSPHAEFLIASAHCCNEMTALGPYVIFELETTDADPAELSFIANRQMTLLRMVLTRIYEYEKLRTWYFSKIRHPSGLRDAYKIMYEEVAESLRNAPWLARVRNKVGAYFDPGHARESLARLSANDPMRFIFGKHRVSQCLTSRRT